MNRANREKESMAATGTQLTEEERAEIKRLNSEAMAGLWRNPECNRKANTLPKRSNILATPTEPVPKRGGKMYYKKTTTRI